MHFSKLFLVSIYLYIGIANASVLAKRKTCAVNDPVACAYSDASCTVGAASCHNHVLWQTCYCSGGTVDCRGC
jgi:hypothetical protein